MLIFVKHALVIALFIFASALLGLGLQATLTPAYVSESKPMIVSVVGLDATLLAIVLGLLIWTSHGLFTGQQSQLQDIVRAVVLLDLALAAYGPQTQGPRRELRSVVTRARGRFWVDDPRHRRALVYGELEAEVVPWRVALFELKPSNDDQRQALASAREKFSEIIDTQVTMIRTLINPVPNLLLNVVIGWSCVLFFGYGLNSPPNALTAAMAALGAILVASAAFLILELSDPYIGLLIMPTTGFDTLMQSLQRFETSGLGGSALPLE